MPTGIFYVSIFFLGTCIGSFLNVVIPRLEASRPLVTARSYCPKCNHTLGCRDLIPIFNFFILRGRCRYCKQKISWQYPIVELATGLLFLLVFYSLIDCSLFTVHCSLLATYYLLITSFLIIIFIYDLKHYIIPDKVIYPAIAITFLYKLFEILFARRSLGEGGNFGILLNSFCPAILASSFFLTVVLISKGRWMGMGDVKMAFFIGLFLGFPKVLIVLFSAFLIGAIIGIGLIIIGKKSLKSEVPFGPFLALGTFLAMLFGNQIISWYLNLI